MFRKYEKVVRFGKEETDGILNGECYIFEKIDGANASVWVEDGQITCGSRNRELDEGESFRGLVKYVQNNQSIKELLAKYPWLRLYGEWLVKHSLEYPKMAYNKLYIFDVYDHVEERFLRFPEYELILDAWEIPYLTPLAILENPTQDQLGELLGTTKFDIPHGEGIVIKNYDFVNRFGNCVYAKMVTEYFQEAHHLKFTAPRYEEVEVRIASQFITEARVRKIIGKIEDTTNRKADIKDTARVLNTVYHDLVEEDMWEIVKKFKAPTVDFGRLRKVCEIAAKSYFFDYLNAA